MTDPFPPLQVPWGRAGTHVGALLTVCIEVLPDLQELGRGQLGQVQVRWLLLWASHGEPLRDLRQHRALPARRLRSRHSPGPARHAAFIYNPEAAPAPCSQQRARVLRESACVSAGRRPPRGSAGIFWVGMPVCAETTVDLDREKALKCKGEVDLAFPLPLSDHLESSHHVSSLAAAIINSCSNNTTTNTNNKSLTNR